jgi:signal transduction histidine kinase
MHWSGSIRIGDAPWFIPEVRPDGTRDDPRRVAPEPCENIATLEAPLDRPAPPIPHEPPPGGALQSRRVLVRSSRDRVVAGVAGGIGERLGVDPTVVRLSFVAFTLAAGIGVILYAIAYLVSTEALPGVAGTAPPRTSARQAFAVGLVVLGALLLLREAGLWLGDGLVWPTVLAALGSAVIWTRGDERDRARWSRLIGRLPEHSQQAVAGNAHLARLVIGGSVVMAGMVQFLHTNGPRDLRRNAPLTVAAALVGAAVIAGPWFWRLGRQLTEERRRRIRSQERAEVAAHLHDSVLQTLALIQRSDEPRAMATLARSQERELRTWLWGGASASDHTLLSTAMNDAAAEVERSHGVAIDVVAVGDCKLDPPVHALVLATREAMVNAATHSGARKASVYVEVEPADVSAYVRDLGSGFDPIKVPPDRRGIADSIEGRIERYGGAVTLVTAPGDGTEVRLRVPRGTQ